MFKRFISPPKQRPTRCYLEPERVKTTFMTEQAHYEYDFMIFRLKNTRETNQRMMTKIFREEIRKTLKVYLDDLIIKSSAYTLHSQHLQRVFKRLWQYIMRLNPLKYTFIIRVGKFLCFYLIERGIKATVIQMKESTSNKDIQRLNRILTTLNSLYHSIGYFRNKKSLNTLLL